MDIPYCINGCKAPAVGEEILGMLGEDEIVELVCYDCLMKKL